MLKAILLQTYNQSRHGHTYLQITSLGIDEECKHMAIDRSLTNLSTIHSVFRPDRANISSTCGHHEKQRNKDRQAEKHSIKIQ